MKAMEMPATRSLQAASSLPKRGVGEVIEEEIEGFLRVYKDGRVERLKDVAKDTEADNKSSKDVMLDMATGIWARIHIPTNKGGKMPVVLYFHGGGFVIGSPRWSIYHDFLKRMSEQVKVVVVSVGYRRAPEHRLPVSYEDASSALRWLRCGSDNWISRHADLSRCFIAGDSAGGNIVHHLAVRAMEKEMKKGNDRCGLKVRGAICIQPFFGNNKKVWSRFDHGLPDKWVEVFWRLSLPVNCSQAMKEHVMTVPKVTASTEMPPVLVCVSELDVLKEVDLEYVGALFSAGKKVKPVLLKGVGHAFQILEPSSPRLPELLHAIRDFVNECR